MHSAILLVFLAVPAFAQGDCPPASSPELRNYQVREIHFRTPFDFFGPLRNHLLEIKPQLPQKEGQPYSPGEVTKGVSVLTQSNPGDMGIGLPVKISAAVAQIENCNDSSTPKTLDLVYSFFTSNISFFTSRMSEASVKESADPVDGSGLAPQQRFAFTPRFGYNRAAKAQAGASLEIRNLGPVDTLALDGEGSSNSAAAGGSFNGSLAVGKPWLNQIDWSVGYQYSDQPSDQGRLKRNIGSGQASALIRNLGAGGPMFRVGGEFERGRLGSRYSPEDLPVGTLAEATYTGIKVFTGIGWRGEHQTLNASYGLQMGATGNGFKQGFRKHIGDVAYQLRLLPRDHTPHEIDLRVSFGTIENLGGLPVVERFFGGNVPVNFIPGEVWSINSSPIIRSFAQNELARAGSSAAGGENFLSFNASYAPTVWKRPLLPAELQNNTEFDNLVQGELNTAEVTLGKVYAGRDAAIQQIHGMTADQGRLKDAMDGIVTVYKAAENNEKGDQEDRFFECMDEATAIRDMDISGMADPRIANAAVFIQSVLRSGGRLEAQTKCASDLRKILGPGIDPALAALKPPADALQAVYAKFDQMRATDLAKADLNFTRRVLDRFFHEINLASIAPVILFDAARIGPPVPGQPAMRYGIGGGIRFVLVSTMRFTLAYAVNPNPLPWERRGALFFSLDVIDLFY
jgi:hypothetical protein